MAVGEYLELSAGWELAPGNYRINLNTYGTGDSVTIKYKTAATQSALGVASWSVYAGAFASLGWVSLRLEG